MKSLKITVFALIALLAVGCTGEIKTSVADNGAIILSTSRSANGVTLVTLEDGTKCAVLIGNRLGGIHCNW